MEFLLEADLADGYPLLHPVDPRELFEPALVGLPGAREHKLRVAGLGPGAVQAAVGQEDHDPARQDGGTHGEGQRHVLVFAGGEAAEEDAEDQARRGHDAHGPARPLLGGLGPGQFFRFI